MKKNICTIIFGCVAGALWSLIPGLIYNIMKSPLDLIILIISGLVTGVSAAFLTRFFYIKSNRLAIPILWTPIIMGVSGFIFGLLLDLMKNIFINSTIWHRSNGGFGFIILAIGWIFLWHILIPISILTIYIQCLMYRIWPNEIAARDASHP